MPLGSRTRCLYSTVMKSWSESELLVDRKSKFQGRCCAISSAQDVPKLLQELVLSNKSIQKASHQHMYAWRTGEVILTDSKTKVTAKRNKKPDSTPHQALKNVQQDCQDGGESGAGQRLLTLLERAGIVNVLVIVTRWYGGTPLGSARFRHISSTAAESLKKGGFL